MMKYQAVEIPEEEVINGEVVYNLGSNMADADNMVYGRLIKAGKIEEAKAMSEERGYWVLLEDGTYL